MKKPVTLLKHSKQKTKSKWTRPQLAVLGLTAVYTLALLWLLEQIQSGPERNWVVLANLYLPQLLWAIPAVLLMLAGFYFRGGRPWLVGLPVLPLLLVLGPLMGLRGYPSPPQPQSNAQGMPLRIMTYNIAMGNNPTEILKSITLERPDVLLIQELGPTFESLLRAGFSHWNIKSDGEFLIATRLPLSSVERVELPHLIDDPWKRPAYVRSVVQLGEAKIAVYNTHLSTPRPALESVRGRSSVGVAQLESNGNTRIYQANVLATALLEDRLPTVVGGDFNAPESSLACQQLRLAKLRDAFSEAGKGYGYTSGHALRFGVSFVRIDHIFVSPQWFVRACYPGEKTGSDHRPVIAELQLSPQ